MARPRKKRFRTTARIPSGAPRISLRAPAYVLKWHAVERWARGLIDDLGDRGPDFSSDHFFGYQALWVADIDDEEEAASAGVPVGELPMFHGPEVLNTHSGGRRRVSIRAYTWDVDPTGLGVGLDPQWITTGWGMSVRQAVERHNRYILNYARGELNHTNSRFLRATALEIVWGVSGPHAAYL